MTIEERSTVTSSGLRRAPWGIRLPRFAAGERPNAGRSARKQESAHHTLADAPGRAREAGSAQRTRLIILLLALLGAIALAMRASSPESGSVETPRAVARSDIAPLKAVPSVRRLDPPAPDAPTESAFGRNPFKFADEPAAPPIVAPPPLPPPPPPVVSPESRFIGTVYRGGGPVALFLYRNDVIAVRKDELLENRYVVRKIEPESVVLEDRDQHISATFSIARK